MRTRVRRLNGENDLKRKAGEKGHSFIYFMFLQEIAELTQVTTALLGMNYCISTEGSGRESCQQIKLCQFTLYKTLT